MAQGPADGSNNVLVPLDNKPLPEPVLTQIYVAGSRIASLSCNDF